MSKSKPSLLSRIAGLCGVITPIITLSLILLSISYSPWFNWSENALSDLGVHEAATLFNSALMIGGVLTLVLAAGLLQTLRRTKTGFTGALVFVVGAVSLFAIGLFPETAGRIHFYVSVSFFASATLSMIIIGVALMKASERNVGVFSVFAGLFAAAVWTVFWNLPHRGVAVPEMLSVLAASAWSVVMGGKIVKGLTLLKHES